MSVGVVKEPLSGEFAVINIADNNIQIRIFSMVQIIERSRFDQVKFIFFLLWMVALGQTLCLTLGHEGCLRFSPRIFIVSYFTLGFSIHLEVTFVQCVGVRSKFIFGGIFTSNCSNLNIC